MRIFLVLCKSANALIPQDDMWKVNFYDSLIQMDHDIYWYDITEYSCKGLGGNPHTTEEKFEFGEKLVNTFKKEHSKKPFDIFLSYLVEPLVERSNIEELKRFNVPTANFSCNDVHQFWLVENIASAFDYCLVSAWSALKKFHDVGANPVYFQMASNPSVYKPLNLDRVYQTTFIGQPYANRPEYVEFLLSNEIDLHVWGTGWKGAEKRRLVDVAKRLARVALANFSKKYKCRNQFLCLVRTLRSKYSNNLHEPLPNAKGVVRVFNQSFLTLGFVDQTLDSKVGNTIVSHVKARDFEAPMCGTLYLTGYTEELTEFYEPEKEVVMYETKYELLDKIRYFQSHPGESDKIRQAGCKRATECHTYEKRFEAFFRQANL